MIDLPGPMTKRVIKKIYDQMTKSFFIRKEKDGEYDVGFFCYIQCKDKKVPVIILNYDSLVDSKYNKINITVDGKEKALELGKIRYKSKEHISIIEIKETNIDFINFIEMDDKLYKKEAEMFYYKEPIYSIQFDNIKETLVSYGTLKEIHNKKIIYSCNLNKNYKCTLIFNLSNNKLIGINESILNNYNTGIFFKYIINEYFLR